jgi:hypothetical protein
MFGRKKAADEDPFAALKEGGIYQSTPTTTVAGIPGSGLDEEPVVVAGAAPVPVDARRGMRTRSIPTMRVSPSGMRRASGPGRLVLWLVILGVLAGIVIPIISSASHAIRSFSIPSFSVPSPSIPSFSTPAPKPRKPQAPASYLTPAGTRAGLARIAKRFPGARVTNLRIDSTSMDAFVYVKGGGIKDLTMNASGTFISSGAGTGERPIAISAVPAGAVARIVRAMRSRFHIPASRIDYTVLTTLSNLPPRWITFAKGSAHTAYAAALDGSDLQKLGG